MQLPLNQAFLQLDFLTIGFSYKLAFIHLAFSHLKAID